MRSFTLRWFLPAMFAVVVLVGVKAQQRENTQETISPQEEGSREASDRGSDSPVFRTGISFIRVDVIVTDGDGRHVRDLEVEDFELFEDGEPQTVESFQLVEISAVPASDAEPARPVINRYDEEREAARADTRVFVIFFDDYHVRWENGVRAGRVLAEFLRNNLYPTDLVGIMHPLTPLVDVRLTRNHNSIFEAAENFFGRKYDYKPLNMYEQRYVQYPTEIVERLRNDVSLSALEGLMIHMGGLREGRKNVLLISEGFSNYVPPELRSSNAEMFSGVSQGPVSINPIEDTLQFFSDQGLFFDLRDVFSTANRFNTAIYSLDPRGLAISEYDMSQPLVNRNADRNALRSTRDTLFVLADETDGRAITNTNDLKPGLEQMLRDSSTYYLLGYNSSRSPTDGKYHEIAVRVKRDGVDVRHRQGFWALTERDAQRALTTTLNEPPKAVDVALGVLAEPRRGRRLVDTWVGMAKGQNGKTKVTFLWEPAPEVRGRERPARVLLTAMSEAGGVPYRGRVPERAGTSRQRRTPGVSDATQVEFEVEPGTLQLSMAIEGDGGDVLERDRREVDIPDFTGADLVLSTPSFFRARNEMEWKVLVNDWEAIPTASRDFRRTERVLVRFQAYAPGTELPEVRARLLNRSGEVIHPLDVRQAASGNPYQVDLRPAHLPPGDYVIEIAVASSTKDVNQLMAFRLRS
jgi:VWFA-related protein